MEKSQKKVVVAVDFSEASAKAVELGKQIAHLHDSELILVHVVEPAAWLVEINVSGSITEERKKRAEKKLSKWVAKYSEGSDVKITEAIVEGKVSKEISRLANDLMAEAIIIGERGQVEDEPGLLGSEVHKITRSADRPVVVSRAEYVPVSINKILIPVDPEFGIRELRTWFSRYKENYQPEIEIVSVSHNKGSKEAETGLYLQKQEETIRKQGLHNVTTKVLHGDLISGTILEYASENGFDMIAMETHGRTGLSSFFLGSITEEVIAQSNIPVLSLKPNRQDGAKFYYSENLPI